MNILALDPSLSSTGFAVIDSISKKLIVESKITTVNKDNTDTRIQTILNKLILIAEVYNVQDVILEDGFIGKNAKTGLQLSELRGAIIFYFKYQKHKVIHQLPSEIRKNFGLPGNSKKEDIAKEVLKYYPNLEEEIGPYSDKANKKKTSDIYDAISIGLSYIINLKE